MVPNDDPSNTPHGDSPLLADQRKWAIGIGTVVLVVALAGLWLSSGLDETGVISVLAVAIAVLAGAGITLWLIEE